MGTWGWLSSPLGSFSQADLEGLSEQACLIASGGFGPELQTLALVEVHGSVRVGLGDSNLGQQSV